MWIKDLIREGTEILMLHIYIRLQSLWVHSFGKPYVFFKNFSACQNVKVILVGKMRILNLLGGFKYKSYVLLILYLQSLSKFKNNMTTEFRFVNMKKKYVGFFFTNNNMIFWIHSNLLLKWNVISKILDCKF